MTGAVPPWLQDDPLEGTSNSTANVEIGPSLQEFLKQSRNHILTFFFHVVCTFCCQLKLSTVCRCRLVFFCFWFLCCHHCTVMQYHCLSSWCKDCYPCNIMFATPHKDVKKNSHNLIWVKLNDSSFSRGAREAEEASTKQSGGQLWSQLTHRCQLAAFFR